MGITPGPANLCSLATAITYGRKPALKQWTGLFTGYVIDSIAAALLCYFVGSVLNDSVKYLSIVGTAYLVFLSVKMLKNDYSSSEDSTEEGKEESRKKGPSFWTGLFVNLTNVKVILSCITELGSFVLPYNQNLWALLGVGLFLPFTGPICNLVWLFTGVALRRFFINHTKVINIIMAISLLICALSLVLPLFI